MESKYDDLFQCEVTVRLHALNLDFIVCVTNLFLTPSSFVFVPRFTDRIKTH